MVDPLTSSFIGGGLNFLSGLFGQSSADAAAERAEKLRYKADMATYNYQTESLQRAYEFGVEGVNIQRANNLQNAAYNDLINARNWQYQMQIRAFDYAMQQRAYGLKKQQAETQIDFNNLSSKLALVEINNWKKEQSLALDFEEKSTNLAFRYNQLGLALNAQEADLARQQTRGMSQLEQQKNYVSSLKAKGETQAKGASGITAEKAAGAVIAEAGLNAAAITQQVFNAEASFGLTSKQISLNLEKLNDQFYLDKSKLAASRVSLDRQAKVAKITTRIKTMEANLQAMYSVGFEPVMGPAPPPPTATPVPLLQDPLKPLDLPPPVKGAAYNVNPMLSGISGALSSVAPMAQQIGQYFGSQGAGVSPYNVNLGFNVGSSSNFTGGGVGSSFTPTSASSLGSFGITDTSVSFGG